MRLVPDLFPGGLRGKRRGEKAQGVREIRQQVATARSEKKWRKKQRVFDK